MADKLSPPSPDGVANEDSMMVVEDKPKPVKPPAYSSSSNGIWPNVKPFVNGGFVGLIQVSSRFIIYHFCPPQIKQQLNVLGGKVIYQNMLSDFVYLPSHGALQFGSFEFLKRKLEAANEGRPLTLHQEACCALASGAITGYFKTPVILAYYQLKAGTTVPKNVFQALYHTATSEGFFALWKGGSHLININMVATMGLLASYSPSLNYIRESLCIKNETPSILGAGLVSGFSFTACATPLANVYKVMRLAEQGGKCCPNNSISTFLNCARELFKLRGPIAFFTGFPRTFFRISPYSMVLWFALEEIRKLEEAIGL